MEKIREFAKVERAKSERGREFAMVEGESREFA